MLIPTSLAGTFITIATRLGGGGIRSDNNVTSPAPTAYPTDTLPGSSSLSPISSLDSPPAVSSLSSTKDPYAQPSSATTTLSHARHPRSNTYSWSQSFQMGPPISGEVTSTYYLDGQAYTVTEQSGDPDLTWPPDVVTIFSGTVQITVPATTPTYTGTTPYGNDGAPPCSEWSQDITDTTTETDAPPEETASQDTYSEEPWPFTTTETVTPAPTP
ncbi:hypothetical protein F5Y13DRAFT_109672 [Hypoxylon sp. FL1857]|nr:hypothetical protein F5Y13DRAFT_109672 [Hypoxylon sp. FL1857]